MREHRGKASDEAFRTIDDRGSHRRGARRGGPARRTGARHHDGRGGPRCRGGPASQHEATQQSDRHHAPHRRTRTSSRSRSSASCHLPQFPPIHIGGLDASICRRPSTSSSCCSPRSSWRWSFLLSARAVARAQAQGRPAKGFAGAMEALALYIRQEVVLPNVGHHGEGFAPYLLTLFFFILAMNLLGLLPWGATATGNIAVTAALARDGVRDDRSDRHAGAGPQGLPADDLLPAARPAGRPRRQILKVVLLAVMTPIEIIGKLSKPFALAVRLFANMTVGARAGAGADRAHVPVPELRRSASAPRCSRPASCCWSCSWRSCRRSCSRC